MPIPERSAGREKTLNATSRTQITHAPVEQRFRLEGGRLRDRGISRIEQRRTGGRGCKQLVYGLDSPTLHLRFLR